MDAADLLRAVQSGYDRYLDDLRALVNVDCGSFTPDGVNRVADVCADRLSGLGFSVRRIPHVQAPGEAELGDCLVATLAGNGPGPDPADRAHGHGVRAGERRRRGRFASRATGRSVRGCAT